MTKLFPYMIGAATALLAAALVPSAQAQVEAWRSALSPQALSPQAPLLGTPGASLNRAAKSDRLMTPGSARAAPKVATVEVVGLRDAAIVYRDRDGRELFRTDPLSNVTIVTKGKLPEVTVRERSSSAVKPVPVETLNEPTQDRKPPARSRKPPLGCEPSFSPVAAPHLSHHTGRCMARLTAPWNQFAG
jgi:hypothetical protein